MGFRVNKIRHHDLFRGENNSDNAFTIIIGNNGCGKTQLLVDTCNFYQKAYGDIFTAKQGSISTIAHYIKNNVSDSWGMAERELGYSLPKKIIAASTSQFEKFPEKWHRKWDPTNGGFYAYIGSKPYMPEQSPSTRMASKALQQLLLARDFNDRKVNALKKFLVEFGFENTLALEFAPTIPSDEIYKALNGEIISTKSRLILENMMEDYDNDAMISMLNIMKTFTDTLSLLLNIQNGNLNLQSSNLHYNDFQYEGGDIAQLLHAGLVILTDIKTITGTGHDGSNWQDSRMRDLASRSSGEQCLFLLFLGTLAAMEDNALVCIDEPEISLHPEWQERFVDIIQDAFSDYHGCHFLIATHSPLIVSDIASSNCQVLDMTRNILVDAKQHWHKSSDYQLANLFHNPGKNNEYLISQIIEVLDIYMKVDRNDASSHQEVLARSKELLAFKSLVEPADKVHILLDILERSLSAAGETLEVKTFL